MGSSMGTSASAAVSAGIEQKPHKGESANKGRFSYSFCPKQNKPATGPQLLHYQDVLAEAKAMIIATAVGLNPTVPARERHAIASEEHQRKSYPCDQQDCAGPASAQPARNCDTRYARRLGDKWINAKQVAAAPLERAMSFHVLSPSAPR